MMKRPISILGGGSWGTTLAWILGREGREVRLWFRDPEQARETAAGGCNQRYLPGLHLPESVSPTGDFEAAIADSEFLVVAVPTSAVHETLLRAAPLLVPARPVLLAAKGLERTTGRRLSEVALEVLGPGAGQYLAVLSGPNLSGEIVRGMPAATVISGPRPATLKELQDAFSTPAFRVYTNRDLVGVELGGALKNPIAIAAGISDGLGFGNNTKAGLLTRGLAEISRLGTAAGARPATFSGLSGLGDLLTTANSPLSRNYRLGFALGQGDSLPHAAASLHQVAEGVPTTEAACILAAKLGVEIPIHLELRRILFQGAPVREAVERLMTRPYRDEDLAH